MYNGAKWFWVYGEKIPRYLDLQNSINTLNQNINNVNNDMWNLYWQNRSYTDQEIAKINMQTYVDDGFTYKTEGQNPDLEVTVSPYGQSQYTFDLTSDGYYTSNNQGIDDSYAYAYIELNNRTSNMMEITIAYILSSEEGSDNGFLSYINTYLSENPTSADNAYVIVSEQEVVRYAKYSLSPGSNFITVKYGKDGSESFGDDCFKFKVLSYIEETKHLTTKEYVDSEVSALSGRIDAIKPNVYVKASKSSMNAIPSPVTNDICYIIEDLDKPIGKEVYPGTLTLPQSVIANTLVDNDSIILKNSAETTTLALIKLQQTVTITLTEPDNQMTTVIYTTNDNVNYSYSSGPQSITLDAVLDVLDTWNNDELAKFILANTKMLTNTYIYDGMWKQIRDEKTATLTTVSVALSQLTTVGGNS